MIAFLKQGFFIAFFLLAILLILVFTNGFNQYHDIFLKVLHTAGVIAATWIVRRFLALTVWRLYEKTVGRAPPHLLLTLQNVFLVMVGLFFIVGGIFHGSLLNVMAAGGLLTAGLAFALQGVIYDWFSGVVLDLDGPYQIGDWVGVRAVEGRVIDINWRHTTLITTDNQIVYAPNSLFLTDAFKNLCRQGDYFYHSVKLVIDANEPIDRVRRILHGSLAALPFLHQGLCDVFVKEILGGGVVYHIKYALIDYAAAEQRRHQVLTALMEAIHAYQIQVNDDSIRQSIPYTPKKTSDENSSLSISGILKKIDVFGPLTAADLTLLSQKVTQKIYTQGQDIVTEGHPGSSLYIVLEGLVEVVLTDPETQENIHVTFLKAGDFFGDRSLLMGEPRSATVRGRTDVLVLEVPKPVFESIFKKNPSIITKISHIMVKRSKETSDLKLAYTQSHENDTLEGIVRRIEQFFGMIDR